MLVPIVSCVFLIHIFSIETAYSGFVDYEKPFLASICCSVLLLLTISAFFCDTFQILISKSDVYVFGLLVLLSISRCFNSVSWSESLTPIWCSGIFYLFVRKTYYKAEEKYLTFFLIFTLSVSLSYIFNIHPLSFLSSMNLSAPINTGLNANFFAPLIPFAMGIFVGASNCRYTLLIRISSILVITLCIYVILQSNARLAYVSILCGAMFTSYHVLLNEKQRRITFTKKFWVYAILLFLILSYYLYQINPHSVNGRFLIYRVSLNIFFDHPFLGIGLGGFASTYNNYQAAFFHSNNLPIEIQLLASDTFQPFNEFLRILIEIGLLGVGLLGMFFFKIIKLKPKSTRFSNVQYGALGALCSIVITCLLSYPLSISSIIINVLFFLAILTSSKEASVITIRLKNTPEKIVYLLPVVIVVVLLLNKEYKVVNSYRNWEKAALYSLEDRSVLADKLYKAEFRFLKNNGEFLFNYGSELVILGQNKKGIEYLEAAKNKAPSTALYQYLGDGYQNEGRYNEAKLSYQNASDIAPSRFLPKYKLLKLYLLSKDTTSAQKIAKEIINYPVKIPSEAVAEIKNFSRSIIKLN